MLSEPQGGDGGNEGMTGGQQMAQMSSEMMNPQSMGDDFDFGGFGDLGGLFADTFMPKMLQTQFADAGGGGFDFGGGFDLGSFYG